jgi:hypothetical protein
MRIIACLLLLVGHGLFGQERQQNKVVITNKSLLPQAVANRVIDAIGKIKNSEAVVEVNIGIPMMPYHFLDPVIVKEVVAANPADTLKSSSFQYFTLEDTFRFYKAYDGRYLTEAPPEQDTIFTLDLTAIDRNRLHFFMGPLDLRIRGLLRVALERNAGLKVTQTPDSISLEVTFPNEILACDTQGVMFQRDTVGLVSKYIITLDSHTYLPLRFVQDLSYHTNIETVLYRKINFTDTLKISALAVNGKPVMPYDPTQVKADTLFEDRFHNKYVQDWKLMEAGGDSLQFSVLKGRPCMMVFNSVGWKPCQAVIPFLKQLKHDYKPSDFDFVSIDPYVNSAGALKNFKQKESIDYPVLMADKNMRRRYRIPEVPVFMLIDGQGVVRKVIVGFEGKATEGEIRNAISML